MQATQHQRFAPQPAHIRLAADIIGTLQARRKSPRYSEALAILFRAPTEPGEQSPTRCRPIASYDDPILRGEIIPIRECGNPAETVFVIACHVALAEQAGRHAVRLLFAPKGKPNREPQAAAQLERLGIPSSLLGESESPAN